MNEGNQPAPAAPSPATPPVAPGSEPAAPVTPAPEAPAQPSQPAAPSTPASAAPPAQPTPEEAAQAAEDKEWDDAADELFPGVKSTQKKGEKDVKTDPETGAEKTPKAPGDSKDEKQEPQPGAGDDTQDKGDGTQEGGDKSNEQQPDTAVRDARSIARQAEQQLTEMKTDVRTKLFPKVPNELLDADGDPIRTVQDVLKLNDPRTGERFTEEAAEVWFRQAQQDFRDDLAKVDAHVAAVAEVNIVLRDEADYINDTYGDLLKADESLRQRLWAEYVKTTVQDPTTGIFLKAPVSLKAFYDIALKPYAEAAKKAKEDAAAPPAPTPPATPGANDKPETPPATRSQKRTDRSDIYAPNNKPKGDPEDEEWAEAAREVFGDQLNK